MYFITLKSVQTDEVINTSESKFKPFFNLAYCSTRHLSAFYPGSNDFLIIRRLILHK